MRHSRGVITLRPSELLEISLILFTIAARQTKLYLRYYFFDWGRQYSQVRFPAIHSVPLIALCPLYDTLSPLQPSVPCASLCTVGGLIMARFAKIYGWENWRCSLHRLDRVEWFFSSTSWDTCIGTKVEIKCLSLKGRLPEMPKVGLNWKVDFSPKKFCNPKNGQNVNML